MAPTLIGLIWGIAEQSYGSKRAELKETEPMKIYSAISYHVTPKSTHTLIKYTLLSQLLMPLKLQLASKQQDFLSQRARGHLKFKKS